MGSVFNSRRFVGHPEVGILAHRSAEGIQVATLTPASRLVDLVDGFSDAEPFQLLIFEVPILQSQTNAHSTL